MKLILTEEQYKLLLKEDESKSLEQFYEENNINEDDLSYLGKGDFGTAYSIGDGRVLKKTNSKTEFEIAKQLENEQLEKDIIELQNDPILKEAIPVNSEESESESENENEQEGWKGRLRPRKTKITFKK